MESGYLYCVRNTRQRMEFKVGKTNRDPLDRLKDFNNSNCPRNTFRLEFAKYVEDYHAKELIVHDILAYGGHRIDPKRELFDCDLSHIRKVFEVIDGTWYSQKDDSDVFSLKWLFSVETPKSYKSKCRDPTKCFHHKQKIKHKYKNHEWIGEFNLYDQSITHDGVKYQSINRFVISHFRYCGSPRKTECIWKVCQCLIDDKWKSIDDLPETEN